MADIRINALATTATTPASDDYLALDGTAQGTRKILATDIANNVTDVILGASGPSVKSTLSARAPRQGLVFDGTGYSNATLTSQIGTSAATFTAFLKVPSAATAANQYIGYVGASFVNEFDIRIGTGGELDVLLFGSSSSNFNKWSWSSFISSYANKSIHFALVRDTSGNPKIYVNGIDITSSGSFTSGGTPPTWQGTIAGTGTGFGFNYVGVHYGLNIYNRALSASEVVALYEAGAPNPADIGYVSGISPAAWAPGFSSPSVTSSSGSSVTATGQYGASFSTLLGTVGAVPVTVVIDVTASNITSAKAYFAGSAADSSGVAASSVITLNQGRNVINLKRSSSGTTYLCVEIAGGVTTWTFTGTNITVGRGLLLAPDAAQAGGGLTWYDTSGNAANITLPASGVSWNVPSSRVLGGNWTTSGNLTVSGGQALTVGGNANYSLWKDGTPTKAGRVILNNTVTNGLSLGLYDGSSWVDTLHISPANNVLVGGTADGGQKLQVSGTAAVSSTLSVGGNTASQQLHLNVDVFGASKSGGMRIGNSGNNYYSDLLVTTDSSANPFVKLSFATHQLFQYAYGGGGNSWTFYTNNTTALTLDSSQNATFAGTGRFNGAAAGAVLNIKETAGVPTALNLTNRNSTQTWSVAVDAAAVDDKLLAFIESGAVKASLAATSGNATFAGTVNTQGGTASTPASASATGTAGTIQWDASYIYVCTAANTWKRVAIATW